MIFKKIHLMKKLFLLIAIATTAVFSQAQEPPVVVYTVSDNAFIERGSNDFYYLHKGETITRMEKEAYLRFLQNNCPEAWTSYQKGTKLWKTGWGLFGGGCGISLAGCIMACVGITTMDAPTYGLYISGCAIATAGDLMIAGSIPCLVVGSIKRNNTHHIYNQYCRTTTPLTFQVQTSGNGIGIAMNF